MAKIGAEALEQIALFQWIKTQPHISRFAFSIPNERKTSPQTGLLLKRMGLRPGVSDVFIAVPREMFHGLFIEMKAGKNKTTKSQDEFLSDMRESGYATAICYGATEAINIIKNYFGSVSTAATQNTSNL